MQLSVSMRIKAFVLIVLSTIIIYEGTTFYGFYTFWRVVMAIAIFLGPALMIKKNKFGATIATCVGIFIVLCALGNLTPNLIEISAITGIDEPTDFRIYLSLVLTSCYLLIAGIVASVGFVR